jgi:hypothetical protein
MWGNEGEFKTLIINELLNHYPIRKKFGAMGQYAVGRAKKLGKLKAGRYPL